MTTFTEGFLKSFNVEPLAFNRYIPQSLGRVDVRRTLYYRRNRREFDVLTERYGGKLPQEGRGASAPTARRFPRLDIREIGGLLGYGLFTLSPLKPGELIGEYTGIVQAARPGGALPGGGYTSDYSWDFPSIRFFGGPWEIDARTAGGVLRFANHSEKASAIVDHFPLDGRWRIIFAASRELQEGEEITVNYGGAYWSGGERILQLNEPRD